MDKLGRMHAALALPTLMAILAGCASVPPEREERDRIILAALEPCKWRYSEYFARDTVRVNQDGRVGYFYWDHLVGKMDEVNQCINEALKDLKVGPWKPGRLAKGGPASSSIMPGPLVVVPVRVNAVAGSMAVSSNSQMTSLTAAYARRAGLQVVPESPTTYVRVRDKTIVIPYARARIVEVGEASVEALDVGVFEALPDHPAVDGVLGNSFLSHFNMTVDRRAGSLTLRPLHAAAPAVPPVALAPSGREWRVPVWTVGDEWELRWEGPTSKGTYVQTVEREEAVDDVVHYVLRSGARRTYYVKDTLAWHFEKDGDGVITLRRTPALTFAWPLAAGKSWQQKYERRGGRNTQQISLTCTAIEEGSTTVPAGTFNTLRIRCDTPARVAWEWWYADEVKHWVRRRSVQGAGDRIDELVSYAPASANLRGFQHPFVRLDRKRLC